MKKNIEKLVARIISEIGDDPERTGLKDTPARVVSSWKELYCGYVEERKPIVTTFLNGNDGLVYREMVVDTGTFYSTCEHHLMPFFGEYVFAYIPSKNGRVLGLSKVARMVQYCAARLQVQERLTSEVVNELWSVLAEDSEPPKGMALMMTANHLCKSMRGVRKEGRMTTTDLRGLFKKNYATRAEFLQLARR